MQGLLIPRFSACSPLAYTQLVKAVNLPFYFPPLAFPCPSPKSLCKCQILLSRRLFRLSLSLGGHTLDFLTQLTKKKAGGLCQTSKLSMLSKCLEEGGWFPHSSHSCGDVQNSLARIPKKESSNGAYFENFFAESNQKKLLWLNCERHSLLKKERKSKDLLHKILSSNPDLITLLPPSVWQTNRDPSRVAQLSSMQSGPPCDVICLYLRGKQNTSFSDFLMLHVFLFPCGGFQFRVWQ